MEIRACLGLEIMKIMQMQTCNIPLKPHFKGDLYSYMLAVTKNRAKSKWMSTWNRLGNEQLKRFHKVGERKQANLDDIESIDKYQRRPSAFEKMSF